MKHSAKIQRWLSAATAVLAACVCAACATQEPPPLADSPLAPADALPSQVILIHEVRFAGENLAMIASWYTGREENWAPILDLNRSLAPQRLKIGNKVRIPAILVHEERRLPEEFAAQFLRDSRRRRIASRAAESLHESIPTSLEEKNSEAGPVEPSNSELLEDPGPVIPPEEPLPQDAAADDDTSAPTDPLRDEFIREMLKRYKEGTPTGS